MNNDFLNELTERILSAPEKAANHDEAMKIIALPENRMVDLFSYTNRIREAFKGKEIFTCGIVNAKSGYCSQDCSFCAQSGHHQVEIKTYPLMDKEEMIQKALELNEKGAKRFSMVTSGISLTADELQTICDTSKAIIEKTGMTICASIGMLTEETAEALKAAGVSQFHHNLETARSYFDAICSTHDYDQDIETIRIAMKYGLRVCSGGIFGLGESWEQRIEMALTLKELNVPSIPINFLNPIPQTPLCDQPLLSPMEALRCIALYRFIMPTRDITICGGREVTLKDFQSFIFYAGANGVMVGNYLTTSGRDIDADISMIKALGLSIKER